MAETAVEELVKVDRSYAGARVQMVATQYAGHSGTVVAVHHIKRQGRPRRRRMVEVRVDATVRRGERVIMCLPSSLITR